MHITATATADVPEHSLLFQEYIVIVRPYWERERKIRYKWRM